MKTNPKLHAIDLFAGCGGLSLGLEQGGFRPVFVCELNRSALETYVRNRHLAQDLSHIALSDGLNGVPTPSGFTASDINEVLEKKYIANLGRNLERELNVELRGIDLVAGGPPCQGFSRIGHRRSYSVDKSLLPSNHLYGRMKEFIEITQPKMFLFENVHGLLSAKWTPTGEPREVWRDVLQTFAALSNYWVAPASVHAADYGVPQRRPRVFIVGLRKGTNPALDEKLSRAARSLTTIDGLDRRTFPNLFPNAIAAGLFPSKLDSTDWPSPADLLADLQEESSVVKQVAGTHRGAIPYPTLLSPQSPFVRMLRRDRNGRQVLEVSNHEYSRHRTETIERFRQLRRQSRGLPADIRHTKKFAQRVLPKAWPSKPNITITSLPDDYVHFSQNRSLTVRESARFQGFPDWYVFHGPRTTGGIRRAGNPRAGIFQREVPQYTQVGNAVPVPLAEHIGSHFFRVITGVNVLSDV